MHASLLLGLVAVVSAVPHIFERQAGSATYPKPLEKGPAPLQAWVDKYNTEKAAGNIPNYAPSTQPVGQNPYYAKGVDTGPSGLCSWTIMHCFRKGDTGFDISDAPDGMASVSFDDGPTPAGPVLYDFLQENNQTSTHFMIGTNILQYPDAFKQAVALQAQIGVHTWSHPYMTSLTDMQVLGELGWTAKIIFDKTGLMPNTWRPPYGDVDDRVRAIARIFGLEHTVIWNQDTNDWCLQSNAGSACNGNNGPRDPAELDAEYQKFARMPKSPGLILLNHEISSRTIAGFINNYQTFISNGWTMKSIADLWGVEYYAQPANGTTSSAARSSSSVVSSSAVSSAALNTTVKASSASSTTTITRTVTGSATDSSLPRATGTSLQAQSAAPPARTAAFTSGTSRQGVNVFLVGAAGTLLSILF